MFSKIAGLGMAAALAVLISAPAFAGPKSWKVDSGHSYGEITTHAQVNESQESVTIGATRVIGTLHFDPEQVAKSSFRFDLDPAGSAPEAGAYTAIRFRSQFAELTSDGQLRVTGPLTVTEVLLDEQLEGNEAYSGPQFTNRIVKETTRQQSFLLAIPSEGSPDASAEARINTEDFPELVNALLQTNWPAISDDKYCPPPESASEGYAGVTCTGSAVGPRSITRTASSFGEDYPGEGSGVAQASNFVTVTLHLRLTQQDSTVASSVGQ